MLYKIIKNKINILWNNDYNYFVYFNFVFIIFSLDCICIFYKMFVWLYNLVLKNIINFLSLYVKNNNKFIFFLIIL